MFKGSIPALITPMKADGAVDFETFEAFVDWQIKSGSDAVVPVGTTGESPTLTHDEHKDVIRAAVNVAAGRVPVIAGTGSNSTREAVAMTRYAEEAGADGALVVAPYYNKPTPAGIITHFSAIHDASALPVIVYNIPGRSVIDISVDTLKSLFELPNIVGLKDATGDLARVARQRTVIGEKFIQLSGEDATAVGFNAMGGVGCISVTANIAPSLCAEMQAACLKGDYATALDLQDRLMPVHDALFAESSPGPVKYAAELLGLAGARVRLPLTEISDETKVKVRSALEAAGLLGSSL